MGAIINFVKKRRAVFSCNVFRAVGPIYALLRNFGFFPFVLEEGGRVHKGSLVNTAVQICLMIGASVYNTLVAPPPTTGHATNDIIHTTQTVVIISYEILSIGASFFERRGVFGLYNELRNLDSVLLRLGMVFKYNLAGEFASLLLRIGTYLVFEGFFMLKQEEGIIEYLLMQVTFAHAILSHLLRKQFTVLLVVLKEHFEFITDRLKSTGESSPYDGRTWKIEGLLEVHDALCSIGDGANKIFAIQCLAGVTCTFIVLTGNAYVATNAIVMGGKTITWNHAANIVFWTLFWSVELWEVVHLSKTTRDESIRFTETLYNLMVDDKTKELSTNRVMCLHMVMGREVEFTAYDFFPLDYTLLHSMIAATTTYLIILIQFS